MSRFERRTDNQTILEMLREKHFQRILKTNESSGKVELLMKKIFALALALMLLLTNAALAVELSPVGEIPLAAETIHFTVGISRNPAKVENYDTNGMTLRLEKDLNVELEFIEYPLDGNEFLQKVELQIMAGGEELPDIIMNGLGGLGNLVKYGQMGMIIPTTEYYQTQTHYLDESLAIANLKKEDLLPYVTCYDGEIYGMFRYHGFLNNSLSGSRVVVFKPWLDKLGMEMPTTTDEFAEMLRRFKNEDPNGNGIADEIPLMGRKTNYESNFVRYLMNPFIYTQENYFIKNEDGTIGFVANRPEWKEGLKWIKSLMDEGLLSPLTITQDNAQLAAVMSEEPTKVGASPILSAGNLPANDTRRGDYIPLNPLTGPEGQLNHQWVEQIPHIQMVITKNCENPEAAFRLGDYMCSEVLSIWNRYGEEGVDWVQPDENTLGTFETLGYPPAISVQQSYGTVQNSYWDQIGPYVLTDRITAGQGVAPENAAINIAMAMGKNIKAELDVATPIINGLIFNEEEQEIVTEFQSTINTYVINSFSEFITGVRDIDAEWDKYVNEFNKMGLDTYMEAINSCYSRMFN